MGAVVMMVMGMIVMIVRVILVVIVPSGFAPGRVLLPGFVEAPCPEQVLGPQRFPRLAPGDGLAREHSRKPDEFYSMIEALAPGTRRVDIFARRHRAGWDCVGNELEKFEAESGAAHG